MTAQSTAVMPVGDSCYCLQLGNDLHRDTHQRILWIYRRTQDGPGRPSGVLDVVPAYSSLGVHFDPVFGCPEDIKAWLIRLAEESVNVDPPAFCMGRRYALKVVYDGADLERVAEYSALSVKEIIRRHSQGVYSVAMIGFRPHFPYLMGLDESLACPRMDHPRSHVPGGSVAIGGRQTGIYPEDGPGGWNIIGRTDSALCRVLKPGDEIQFVESFSL